MKKILIILLLLTLTGCSIVRIDVSSIDNTVDVILSKKNTLYNEDGQGYKYYIPNGVTHIDTNDLMHTLYYNGEYLYLYVDIVSYYYKNDINYKKSNNSYFYKKINNGKQKGYVEVTQQDNLYYVNFQNASYILSTINYNKKLIKTMLDEEYFTNKTGKYDLYKTNEKTEKFVLQKDKEGE